MSDNPVVYLRVSKTKYRYEPQSLSLRTSTRIYTHSVGQQIENAGFEDGDEVVVIRADHFERLEADLRALSRAIDEFRTEADQREREAYEPHEEGNIL